MIRNIHKDYAQRLPDDHANASVLKWPFLGGRFGYFIFFSARGERRGEFEVPGVGGGGGPFLYWKLQEGRSGGSARRGGGWLRGWEGVCGELGLKKAEKHSKSTPWGTTPVNGGRSSTGYYSIKKGFQLAMTRNPREPSKSSRCVRFPGYNANLPHCTCFTRLRGAFFFVRAEIPSKLCNYPLAQNYYLRKIILEKMFSRKLRISRVIPWKLPYFLGTRRAQSPSRIPKKYLSEVLVFFRVWPLTCLHPAFCPPTICTISLEFHRKPSILAADNFLGACYRKSMTPKRHGLYFFPSEQEVVWTFPQDQLLRGRL